MGRLSSTKSFAFFFILFICIIAGIPSFGTSITNLLDGTALGDIPFTTPAYTKEDVDFYVTGMNNDIGALETWTTNAAETIWATSISNKVASNYVNNGRFSDFQDEVENTYVPKNNYSTDKTSIYSTNGFIVSSPNTNFTFSSGTAIELGNLAITNWSDLTNYLNIGSFVSTNYLPVSERIGETNKVSVPVVFSTNAIYDFSLTLGEVSITNWSDLTNGLASIVYVDSKFASVPSNIVTYTIRGGTDNVIPDSYYFSGATSFSQATANQATIANLVLGSPSSSSPEISDWSDLYSQSSWNLTTNGANNYGNADYYSTDKNDLPNGMFWWQGTNSSGPNYVLLRSCENIAMEATNGVVELHSTIPGTVSAEPVTGGVTINGSKLTMDKDMSLTIGERYPAYTNGAYSIVVGQSLYERIWTPTASIGGDNMNLTFSGGYGATPGRGRWDSTTRTLLIQDGGSGYKVGDIVKVFNQGQFSTGMVATVTQISNNTTSVQKLDVGLNTRPSGAVGNYSLSWGNGCLAWNDYSIANGGFCEAYGYGSHAEGDNCIAYADYSHAEGRHSKAYDNYAHAEGDNCLAWGTDSHAEGVFCIASNSYAHAEGDNTIATGPYSHSAGKYTHAKDEYSYAWSGQANSSSIYESNGDGTYNIDPIGGIAGFYIGTNSLKEYMDKMLTGGEFEFPVVFSNSFAQGSNVIASGNFSYAGGNWASATDNVSFAWSGIPETTYYSKGPGTFAVNPAGGTSGFYIGNQTLADYIAGSMGEYVATTGGVMTGPLTISGNAGIITMGTRTNIPGTSVGINSFAMGVNVLAGDKYAMANGEKVLAYGYASHAEGKNTAAYHDASHAEGKNTTAYGGSHAEGSWTVASNAASHAEGTETRALGVAAHAEGNSCIATGGYSHAEGYGSIAQGVASHAQGYSATAAHNYSFVWNGDNNTSSYSSPSQGTFCINPEDGTKGFYIGNQNLNAFLDTESYGFLETDSASAYTIPSAFTTRIVNLVIEINHPSKTIIFPEWTPEITHEVNIAFVGTDNFNFQLGTSSSISVSNTFNMKLKWNASNSSWLMTTDAGTSPYVFETTTGNVYTVTDNSFTNYVPKLTWD